MLTFNVSSILFYYICVSTPQAILLHLDLRFYWDTAVQSMCPAKIKQNLVLKSGPQAPHSSSLTCSIYLSLQPVPGVYLILYPHATRKNIMCYLTQKYTTSLCNVNVKSQHNVSNISHLPSTASPNYWLLCYLMPSHFNIHSTSSMRCVIPYITNSQHLRFIISYFTEL